MCGQFFSHACEKILLRAFERLSFPKTTDGNVGQFMQVSRDLKHLFTFSDQCEWGTGEFLSYDLYNYPFRCFHKVTIQKKPEAAIGPNRVFRLLTDASLVQLNFLLCTVCIYGTKL